MFGLVKDLGIIYFQDKKEMEMPVVKEIPIEKPAETPKKKQTKKKKNENGKS